MLFKPTYGRDFFALPDRSPAAFKRMSLITVRSRRPLTASAVPPLQAR